MADIKKFAKRLMKYEGGYKCEKEDKGDWNSKCELVGTNYGVSAQAYEKFFHKVPSIEDMKNITPEQYSIVCKSYWDNWQADQIKDQSLAEFVVDWHYNSGAWGIKKPQEVLLLKPDGIVGAQTIARMNDSDPKKLFEGLKKKRLEFIDSIIINNPVNKKYEKGWKNRVNDFVYGK